MKHRMFAVVAVLALAFAALPAAAQTVTVKGSFKGPDGKPVPDIQVDLVGKETGQKYHLKTDKKGEFFSLGVVPGVYDINFTQNGNLVWAMTNYTFSVAKPELNNIDVDLQKENAQHSQATEAQKKEMERVQKENASIKELNVMLQQSQASIAANDPDAAVAVMAKATQMDATRPVLWGELGRDQVLSAKKETDTAAKKDKYVAAADSFKKAIDLANASPDVKLKSQLGSYYNNYAESLTKSGNAAAAMDAYDAAAKSDPANAAMYYTNAGITMENAGKVDEAVAAYDKAIAADPAKPDPYFRKGITLLAKATTKGDKMVAVPGTAESFNKYLELAPDGPNAETAKQMLDTIGAKVETSFGKTKKK